MRIMMLCLIRWILTGLFVLFSAASVGLFVYAILLFGLWWPSLLGVNRDVGLVLAAITMLPFLIVFVNLKWSRLLSKLIIIFTILIQPLNKAIDELSCRN